MALSSASSGPTRRVTRPLSSRSSAGSRSDGKSTCRVVKSGLCLGSSSLRGFVAGSRARSVNESVLVALLLPCSAVPTPAAGVVGAGISEMEFRMEVRSCLGVGRADDDEDILQRGRV